MQSSSNSGLTTGGREDKTRIEDDKAAEEKWDSLVLLVEDVHHNDVY
jgi:hypothetical protein